MSLKAFHILFITLSTLLALGFGAWSLNEYSKQSDGRFLAMGILALVIGVALIVYGILFLRKLKKLDTK